MKVKLIQGDSYLSGKVVEAEPCVQYGMDCYEFELAGATFIVPANWIQVLEQTETK